MYIIKIDGMKAKSCRSFNEAKAFALAHKGKVYKSHEAKLPSAAMLRFNDSECIKREVFREIYSENNHGYHYTKKGRRWE